MRGFRDVAVINRAATIVGRRITRGRPPEWLLSHLPRLGEVRLAVPGGRDIRLWSNGDDWVSSRVWWLGIDGYEPESVRPFLRFAATARTILDVGAYVGYYSLVAKAVNPGARVLAFEPHPALVARIGRNLTLNPELEITVLPVAVSDRVGPVSFHLGGGGLPSSSGLDDALAGIHHSMRTSATTLDEIVERWGLDDVDLVKIDVEGHEPAALAGAETLLRSQRPVVQYETTQSWGTAEAIGELIGDLGYRCFVLTPDGPRDEGRPRHLEGELFVNHLLVPGDRVPDWLAGAPALDGV